MLPVSPGRGGCGYGGPAQAPEYTILPAGVVRCGILRRTSPGKAAHGFFRGVRVLALTLARLPVFGGRAVRARCPHTVGAGVQAWGSGTGASAGTPCWALQATGVGGSVPGEAALVSVRGVWS